MPRVLFAFRKDEAIVSNTKNTKTKVKARSRFGGRLLNRNKTVVDGDMKSIMTHLGTSSETVSSSENQNPQEPPPSSPSCSSFRISILEIRHENQNEMMLVSNSSSSSLGSSAPRPGSSVVARDFGGGNSSRISSCSSGYIQSDAATAPNAAAKQRFNHHHHDMLPPSPPTCTNIAVRRDGVQLQQRSISFHLSPSEDEEHEPVVNEEQQDHHQLDQPSPVRNYMLQRRMSVAPSTGPLCYWIPNSNDAATLTTDEATVHKANKHVSFSSMSSSPPPPSQLRSTTLNRENIPLAPTHTPQATTIRDNDYDFDIYKARNSFSLTDNNRVYHHDYLPSNRRDYLKRAVQFSAATPPIATSRPRDVKRQQLYPQKKSDNHDADDDDDDTATAGGESMSFVTDAIGFGEHSIFSAATATANHRSSHVRRNNSTVVQIHSNHARTSVEKKHQHTDSDSEESIVLLPSDHHDPHHLFQPAPAMTRVTTGPVPLPTPRSIIRQPDDSSNMATITRQQDDSSTTAAITTTAQPDDVSSASQNAAGVVRFSDRILCYSSRGGATDVAADTAGGDGDAASISSSLHEEPPSLAGCLGVSQRFKSTNSEVSKSKHASHYL
jgi:hypothetical protein